MTENNKRIRTAARKSVTKAMNTAKDYTSEDIGEHDLRSLSTLIKTKLNILDDLDAKILISCEEEDLDREMTDSDTYQTNIYISLAAIERFLENLRLTESIPSSPNNSIRGLPTSHQQNMRLPKINIPTFDGNLLGYQTFMVVTKVPSIPTKG